MYTVIVRRSSLHILIAFLCAAFNAAASTPKLQFIREDRTLPLTVNLTTDGPSDWVHWGTAGLGEYDRKSGGGLIGALELIGPAGVDDYAGTAQFQTGYSWTNGTTNPTASVFGGLHTNNSANAGEGFQFTAPADTKLRRLRVYCGVWAGPDGPLSGRLTLTLSDGSATVNDDITPVAAANAGDRYYIYTITYAAGTANATLNVKWIMETAAGTQKHATLDSAALRPMEFTWTGGGADTNWNNPLNWAEGSAPNGLGGEELVFPSGPVNRTTNNNLPAGSSFNHIAVSGDGYVLAGNSISLAGNIVAASPAVDVTVSLPMQFTAIVTANVNAGITLNFDGVITGPFALIKSGAGTLQISGANSYSGATVIATGTLTIANTAGSATGTGTVNVVGGARLSGAGTISGTISVADTAILEPAGAASGKITCGALTLTNRAILNFDVGSKSDQIVVTGALTLDGILNVNHAAGYATGSYILLTYATLTDNTLEKGTGLTALDTIDTSVNKSVSLIVSADTPTITSFDPTSGPTTGGTQVTITGTNLLGVTEVLFGTTPATFGPSNDTSVVATAPAHAAGRVNITVTATKGTVVSTDQFNYVGPAIDTVNPGRGPSSGGQVVTLTGTQLSGATAVKFGTFAAATFTVDSATTITATTASGAAGTVDVAVTTPSGDVIASQAYTYVDAPVIGSITPDSGPENVANDVTITGSHFSNATVSVDSQEVAPVSLNDTQIVLTVPGHAAGDVTITVTTIGGSDDVTFTFIGGPIINSVDPTSGPAGGGQTVTLAGQGMTGVTSIFIGGIQADIVSGTNTDTEIEFTTPPHAAGAVTIEVTTPGGTTLVPGYTYVAAPVIGTVTPNFIPIAGGQTITISGNNFLPLGGVTLTVDATPVNLNAGGSATQISFTAPAHAAGAVNLTVSGIGGSTTAFNALTYLDAPSVSQISPAVGGEGGGTAITISGLRFVNGATVTIGGQPATNVHFVSATSLTATTPAHAPGIVNVSVTNPDQQSSTLQQGFTYNAAPTIASGPQFTPANPLVGRPVAIAFTTGDAESDNVSFTLDWGDGTALTTNLTHTYSAAGTYTVTITLIDGFNVVTHTATITVGPTTPFTVSKLAGAFKFAAGGKDTVQLSGIIPAIPQGFDFNGKTMTFEVAGAQSTFTLDAKGKAKIATGSLALKIKIAKGTGFVGGPVSFSVKYSGTFADDWASLGIDPNADIKTTVTVNTDVLFNGKTYTAQSSCALASKKGKGGTFKKSK